MQTALFLAGIAGAAIALGVSLTGPAEARDHAPITGVLSYTMKDIDGKDVPLSMYKGKVLLIVNTASKCGNTPQYKPMEEMYEKYKNQGFVVLAFPANNFGAQEPGSNAEIKEFCHSSYKTTFPLFSKISVKGDDTDPLYKYLTVQDTAPVKAGPIEWNFAKYVVGRDGNVVARYPAGTHPDVPEIVTTVETELKKPAK